MSETTKILVVDDQPGMRLTLKGILSKKGYQVTVSEDGKQALEEARRTQFQIVFMDIKMPGMNGVETFLRIKEVNPRARVIMMTAYSLDDEIERAIREGAYTVVHKPFDVEKVLEVVVECAENRTLVLLVDDQAKDLKFFRVMLEDKGYKVVDVESGEECIRRVREKRFDIILMDIKLPGIDGVETLKRVKEIQPDISVIMITAYPVPNLKEEALRSGSYAFLDKPLDANEFLNVITRCLECKVQKSGGQQ